MKRHHQARALTLIVAVLLAALGFADQTVEALTDADGESFVRYTVSGQTGTTVEGVVADELVVKDCVGVTIKGNTIGHLRVIDSSRIEAEVSGPHARGVEVTGGFMVTVVAQDVIDPTPEDAFVIARNSPGFQLKNSQITGGGVWAVDCFRAKATNNFIDLSPNRREGIRFDGCDDFEISGNAVTGTMERGAGNDLIQIGPSPKPERTYHSYKWPDRNAFRFTSWVPPSDWVEPYSKSVTFMVGEHAGKTITYGHDEYNWTKGGLIMGNTLRDACIASVFIYRADGVQVIANKAINSRDYNFGLEWAKNCEVKNNVCHQEDEYIGVGTGGGIASMYYGENHVIQSNTVRNARIMVSSLGEPQTNITVADNTANIIDVLYGSAPWVDGVFILRNKVTNRIGVSASPFYTKGAIVGNFVQGSPSHTFGISVEAFEGPIMNNTIIQPNRNGVNAFRDFNRGAERMTSKPMLFGNTVNGKEAVFQLAEPKKPPVFELVPVPALDGSGGKAVGF